MPEAVLENAVAEALQASREGIGASRARCYAMTPGGVFRLAASYGFPSRFQPDDALEPGHPLIEWTLRHPRPSFVNSPRDAGRLGERMERDHYARSLAAPLYQGSRLTGILELQDKPGGAPFTAEDVAAIEEVRLRIETILGRFADPSMDPSEPEPRESREALFLDSRPDRAVNFPSPPDLFSGVEEPAPESASPVTSASLAGIGESGTLTPREVLVLKSFINALLLDPEIDAVVFSHWRREKAELYIGARRPFASSGREMLLQNLETALRSAVPELPIPRQREFHDDFPLGRSSGEIREPGGVQTSVVFSGRDTLLLSLVFPRPPVLTSDEALKQTHRLVRAAILQIRRSERYRISYRSLVHSLVEPDRRTFPQLKAHSLSVGALCRRFATKLKLPLGTVEQVTVAGLLHDIGLKDLDIPYERIAGRRPLDLQDLGFVRQHSTIAASFLSRIDFPYPVAPLVRHHHERYDGGGYPDRLSGDRIPLGSRVIGIAEAYDAMISPYSYRAPISQEAALEIILLKGGSQFDPALTREFCELIRSSSPPEEPDVRHTEP